MTAHDRSPWSPRTALVVLVVGLAVANVVRSTIVAGRYHLPFNLAVGGLATGVGLAGGLGAAGLGSHGVGAGLTGQDGTQHGVGPHGVEQRGALPGEVAAGQLLAVKGLVVHLLGLHAAQLPGAVDHAQRNGHDAAARQPGQGAVGGRHCSG